MCWADTVLNVRRTQSIENVCDWRNPDFQHIHISYTHFSCLPITLKSLKLSKTSTYDCIQITQFFFWKSTTLIYWFYIVHIKSHHSQKGKLVHTRTIIHICSKFKNTPRIVVNTFWTVLVTFIVYRIKCNRKMQWSVSQICCVVIAVLSLSSTNI